MPEHYDADAETVDDTWVGVFISCSWGYDQTQNNYAQIVDVSGSGKTVVARRVGTNVEGRPNKTTEKTTPDAKHVGPEFRLHVRSGSNDRPMFKGSYPYIWSEIIDYENDPKGYNGEPSTRMGLFLPCDNHAEPDYQTAPNAGH